MNREIKFRAFCTADGYDRMVYFGAQQFDNGIFAWPMPKDISHIDEYLSPLMQSAGLKDKWGKGVWEGDIVRWDDGSEGKYWRVAVVFYDDRTAMFSFRIIANAIHELSCEEGHVFGGNFAYRSNGILEVVGNIYENPKLTKRKQHEI